MPQDSEFTARPLFHCANKNFEINNSAKSNKKIVYVQKNKKNLLYKNIDRNTFRILQETPASNASDQLLEVKSCSEKILLLNKINRSRASIVDQALIKRARTERRKYHQSAIQAAQIIAALSCIDTTVDPRSVAVHMKNHQGLGEKVDFAIDWLNRFAEELHNRGDTGY